MDVAKSGTLAIDTPELSTSNFWYYNRCFHVLHPQVPQGTFVSSVRRKSARALPPGGGCLLGEAELPKHMCVYNKWEETCLKLFKNCWTMLNPTSIIETTEYSASSRPACLPTWVLSATPQDPVSTDTNICDDSSLKQVSHIHYLYSSYFILHILI